jgi:hypothetical protein
MGRHRKLDKSIKGDSNTRVYGDARQKRYEPAVKPSKYDGAALRNIRLIHGVGRPPKEKAHEHVLTNDAEASGAQPAP